MSTIHNPTNLRPEDYSLLAWYYLGTSEEMGEYVYEVHQNVMWLDADLTEEFNAKNGFGGAKCEHCGAWHLYGAAFRHEPSGDMVLIGNTCAAKTFLNYATEASYQKARLQKEAAKARTRAKNAAALESYLDEDEELAEAFEKCDHYIVEDIRSKALRWAAKNRKDGRATCVSSKQRDLVLKLYREQREKTGRREKEAKEAGPVPTGRVELEGVVRSVKVKDSRFGWSIKCLVELDNGARVWGTLPSAIDEAEKGDRVKFRGTVDASDDDPTFGFYKRPSNAEIVERADQVA